MHLVWHLQTTPTSFMSVLSATDHTYSEGLIGPLHLYPGGLGKERHFITLKEEGGGQILSADLRSNDKQWSEATWVLAKHSIQAWYSLGLRSPCVVPLCFSQGLCASMHMDNMTTLTAQDEPRQEKQSSQGCESLIFTAVHSLSESGRQTRIYRIFSFFPHSAW